jgi:uncharacterized LabA/DUF88 family protein
MARVTDPDARVLVFIDGQNLFQRSRDLYGNGRCHPILIAQRVADGRRLVGVRYYSGVHDPNVRPDIRAITDRRHHLMRSVGVTVVERRLRYRWEWGFDPQGLPEAEQSRGQRKKRTVRPYQRAREKGIDLAIGLDVIDLALEDTMDVAVIVSSDNDLCEAARATHAATIRTKKRVSVEAALFNEGRGPILLQHYDYTHQLKRRDHDACSDTFDYAQSIDPAMRDLFVASCDDIRRHFGAPVSAAELAGRR